MIVLSRPRTLHVNLGDSFGRLTIIGEAPSEHGNRRVLCECTCRKIKSVQLTQLLSGNTKSCGCLKKEVVSQKNTTHGLADHLLYGVWSSMKGRCLNPTDQAFKNYGGRGISVCSEWMDFRVFYAWAINNGYKKGLTIERVNTNGNYAPTNCKWIPRKDQNANRRRNRLLTLCGETKTMAQWSRDLNINYGTLKDRLRNGWSVEKALTTPKIEREVI